MNNPNNDGLFEQVLQAQETQREGWMPEIKQGELVARLERICCDQEEEIDRLKKELGEKDAQIVALREALNKAKPILDQDRDLTDQEIFATCGEFYIARRKALRTCESALSAPALSVVPLEDAKKSIRHFFDLSVASGEMTEAEGKYASSLAVGALSLIPESLALTSQRQ